MFGNVFLNLFALTLTTASMVALLQPSQPVFASILSICLGHEQPTTAKLLGASLCVIGGFVAAMSQNGVDDGFNFGVLAIMAQCACGANYIVQQRPLVHVGYSPLIVSGVSYAAATFFTIAVGGAYFVGLSPAARLDVQWWDPSPFFALVLLYCVLLTTVYNYVVIAWVCGRLGATVVTLFTLLQGVFCAAAEFVLYGTPPSPGQLAGGAAVVAGLCLAVGASAAEGGRGAAQAPCDAERAGSNSPDSSDAEASSDGRPSTLGLAAQADPGVARAAAPLSPAPAALGQRGR